MRTPPGRSKTTNPGPMGMTTGAAEGAPGVLALRVHFGDVWVARAEVLEAVHIEGEPAA